jgi:hypothetical protein
MNLIRATFLAVTALIATPLAAADEGTLRCISDGIDPKVAKRLADAMLASLETESDPAPGDREIEAIAGQALICKGKHGWSEPAFDAAITHAVTVATIPAAETALKRDGFDPGQVATVFRSLPLEIRAGFQQSPVPDASVEAYLSAVQAAGVNATTEKEGGHLGMLAGLLAVADDARSKFKAN